MNDQSKPGTLNKPDIKSIAWGALDVTLAALLDYAATHVGLLDFGPNTPYIVALLSVLIKTGRKLLQG